ncbi:beta-lactamase/transpeptidase-like protein [Fimicolochytrium jonesii]|uniref:beta-lactamase/transpeptidase-like protein n=1 Tax=Fimicolochytrium jonesii TaxID=1396493 RepID=UPI0022FEC257|nr:beta-lactamase/transpeptidase-like protein [Fimicolochytrium jonesii]KAI8816449.1 beta-lactamase/transpeptidase-like protein [Fimicolochytrium jonesii]
MFIIKTTTAAAVLSCTVALIGKSALALPVDVAALDPHDPSWAQPLTEQLNALREKLDVHGASVAVVHEGRTWLRALGHKDIAKTQPVTIDTSFLMGSVTKSFTALGAARAVAKGQMHWDTPLQEYVHEFWPNYPGFWDPDTDRNVTLADLLSHRTGVAGNIPVLLAWNTTESFLQHQKNIPPSAPLRTRFQYSNAMFGLAGYLTAKATGHADWAAQIRQDIFVPLHLSATRATMAEFMEMPDRSLGQSTDTDRIEDVVLQVESAGAISTSVRDFAKYARALLQTFRGDADPLAIGSKVFQPFRDPQMRFDTKLEELYHSELLHGHNTSDLSYTFGLFKGQWRNYTFYLHGGNNLGYASNLCLLPEANLAVAVLSSADNTRNCFREEACATAFDAVLGTAELGEPKHDCPAVPASRPFPQPGPLPLPTSAYTGEFQSRIMGKMLVGVDAQGNLTMAVGERRKFMTGTLYAPAGGPTTSMSLIGKGAPALPPFMFTAKVDANSTAVQGYYFVLDGNMVKICDEPGPGCQDFFKRVDAA